LKNVDEIVSYSQFHQNFTGSFCPNIFARKASQSTFAQKATPKMLMKLSPAISLTFYKQLLHQYFFAKKLQI